jgi:uncharacterized damage-inducible protein DinB
MSTPVVSPVDEGQRYPIGRFQMPGQITDQDVLEAIASIEQLPADLRQAVEGLSDSQLDTPYRAGGWTVRQVVHHIADSHMNSYVRFRLTLTEDTPAIKPYKEAAWAELADARTADVDLSLKLVDALHARWVLLLRSLSKQDLERAFRHAQMGDVSLAKAAVLYSWHGRHHLSQITSLRLDRS